MTPTYHFEEGEQTLIRPDHHHHEEPKEPGEELERKESEEISFNQIEVGVREELLFKGTSKSETKSNGRRKKTIISSEAGQECDDVEYKSERRAAKFISEKKLQDDVR